MCLYKNAKIVDSKEKFIESLNKEIELSVDGEVIESYYDYGEVPSYVRLSDELEKIYGTYLNSVILYGSFARGDFSEDSDIDIMILLDLDDTIIKKYRHELSGMTYDFNMDYNIDIKPIAKSKEHFEQWIDVYPFYKNVKKDGVQLFKKKEGGTQNA